MRLKSGRELPDADELTTYGDNYLAYGYDGCVEEISRSNPLTTDEKREIADAVIAHWERWARAGTLRG